MFGKFEGECEWSEETPIILSDNHSSNVCRHLKGSL